MKKLFLLAACVFLFAACDESSSVGSHGTTVQQINNNQDRLVTSVPNPQLSNSLERKNISDRLQRLNAQNMNGYIYLLSFGHVMAYYPVKGKVSSLNSFLTPQEEIHWGNNGAVVTTATPDLDGSYGENDSGIFFFTTGGVYVEWHGDYLFSDSPLTLSQQPELIMNVK